MTDNPYESPRADPERSVMRNRRSAWWQDRLALVTTAIVITAMSAGLTWLGSTIGMSTPIASLIAVTVSTTSVVLAIVTLSIGISRRRR